MSQSDDYELVELRLPVTTDVLRGAVLLAEQWGCRAVLEADGRTVRFEQVGPLPVAEPNVGYVRMWE